MVKEKPVHIACGVLNTCKKFNAQLEKLEFLSLPDWNGVTSAFTIATKAWRMFHKMRQLMLHNENILKFPLSDANPVRERWAILINQIIPYLQI